MKEIWPDTNIKLINRQTIYNYIYSHDGVSRQEIAYDLRLSLPTVISNIEYLQKNNLIEISDEMRSTGGRKASAYVISKNAKKAIGLYLTEHHIRAAAIDLAGNVVCTARKKISCNLDDEDYLKELSHIVEHLREKSKTEKEDLLGVGIAVPGILSKDNETILIGANSIFNGKTRQQIAKHIEYDTALVHDSQGAVFAETWAEFPEENAFYIGLNSHVGGAAMIQGTVYNGDNNHSGEIGHIKLAGDLNRKCYCGKTGCLETACAASLLAEMTNQDLDLFFKRLKAGDKDIVAAWETYLQYLAKAIITIRLLYDCPVIIGGYVGAYIGDYLEQLYELVDRDAFFDDLASTYIRPCKYTVEAVGAGAALLFVDRFIHSI